MTVSMCLLKFGSLPLNSNGKLMTMRSMATPRSFFSLLVNFGLPVVFFFNMLFGGAAEPDALEVIACVCSPYVVSVSASLPYDVLSATDKGSGSAWAS